MADWTNGEAERDSINHPVGAPVWVNENATRDKCYEIMIEQTLPAIVVKFPSSYLKFGHSRDGVFIQQDGARAHIKDNDNEFAKAVASLGVNISIHTQPANSPDLNINNLGFFCAIQALHRKTAPDDKFDLTKAVEEACNNYPPEKINYIWVEIIGSLQ